MKKTLELLKPNSTLLEAIKIIESSFRRIAVIVDNNNEVRGTITDGDIRRAILNNHSLSSAVSIAMNTTPVIADETATKDELFRLMSVNNILAVPLLNACKKFSSIAHLHDINTGKTLNQMTAAFECAVIMAGGQGLRLRPLTERIPKPLVDVGGMPIIERQIRNLSRFGIKKIFLAINYLGEMIKEYFGNGEWLDVEIKYIEEKAKLGTAGALSLLQQKIKEPIIVINGDIVTESNFASLFAFHQNENASLTIAATPYKNQIPYGVLEFEGSTVTDIKEKPTQVFMCSAGVYAISPEVQNLFLKQEYMDMPQLIRLCLTNKQKVAIFPLHEYWNDIGNERDLFEAKKHFGAVLNND